MKTTPHGSSLVAVMFVVTTISLMLGAVFAATSAQARFMRRSADRAAAMAYGDGVLESVYDQWRIAMTDSQRLDATQRTSGLSTSELMTGTATSPSTKVPANLPLKKPASSVLALPDGVSLTAWNVSAADPYLAALSPTTLRPTPESGTNSRMRVRLYYLATATMAFPRGNVTVQRTFTRSGRNLFDNFLYSAQPVTEFHPGAPMYVDGTIYAGGDLYMAKNYLHFLQDVSYTGDRYLNFKGGAETGEASSFWDSRYGSETPSITSAAWPASSPPHQGSQQKLLDTPAESLDPNFLDDYNANDTDSDGNPNNNGYYEIVKEVSDATKTDPLQMDTSGTSQRLAGNADYRIYVDAANNITIYKGTSTTPLSASNSEAVALRNALTPNTSIADQREGDNVRLVNVDVGALTTAVNSNKVVDSVGNSDGLLLYVRDTSFGTSVKTNGYTVSNSTATAAQVTSSKARGLRLVNGGVLPATGLSIASPNAVYIQGDYNTGTTSSTKPASNNTGAYTGTADPSPVVTSYDRAASVVVGDSVNILSNKWTDAVAAVSQSKGLPPSASATTVNTAIVAGNVPTTRSSYSGGIENFPRFHENWSGVYFTVYGSFSLLYNSTQAKGPWASALYNPPDRHWYFDTTLQVKNPPGFPVAFTYDRGRWSIR